MFLASAIIEAQEAARISLSSEAIIFKKVGSSKVLKWILLKDLLNYSAYSHNLKFTLHVPIHMRLFNLLITVVGFSA